MNTARSFLRRYSEYADISIDDAEKALKAAVEEAIRECAEAAETKTETAFSDDIGTYEYQSVDKQSILSLINQIK